MRAPSSLAAVAASLLASVATASTLTPPILPLIVRTPYLSTWLTNAREEPWSKWPIFWTGSEIGFSVMASVPTSKVVYPLLGRPHDSLDSSGQGDGYNVSFPVYKGANYDASTTNLTYNIPSPDGSSAGPLELTLSFLSPVTPTSTLRQSIPAAYLNVYVTGSFDVDVYVDVNGQWVSGDRGSRIEWELKEGPSKDTPVPLKSWYVKRASQLLFTETWDHAEWGHLLFTGPSDVRHESGTSSILRQRFSRTGTLQNENDHKFREIMEEEPVFAFSKSFKLKSSGDSSQTQNTKSDSVLFTIAHIQDPVVHYASARGLTHMRPLWKSWFLEDDHVIKYHYLDFHNAKALASNYSDQLAVDAFRSGAEDYVDIVALSARQVMGATSFAGTPDNPILFLKEISSNGNCQTVDVIFPSFPFFLYTNPRWLSYLLEPLLEHQLSGQYPNDYSMHDLGAHFPNQTGHADGRDEYMPVEECGDMLIMALALANSLAYQDSSDAQSIWSNIGNKEDIDIDSESIFALTNLGSHDGIDNIDDTWGGGNKGATQAKKWVSRSYKLWKQWTSYLVKFSLRPHNQLSTDDFAGWLALQVNLALKGIIGIKAMSELAAIVGNDEDVETYRNISETYVKKWEEFATSRDETHVKLAYDWYGSWTTLYSLYADAVLCFHPSLTNSSAAEETVGPQSIDDQVPSAAFVQAGQDRAQKPLKTVEDARKGDDPQKPLKPPPGRQPITSNFIPSHVYTRQSKWYANVMQKYGLPLDSRHLYTKSDWEFEAAAVTSKSVRADILQRVAKWLNETVTDRPFTDLYNTEGRGEFPGPNFFARPVVGGHFAFLTLERACGGTGTERINAMFADEN